MTTVEYTTKWCPGCYAIKSISDFYINTSNKKPMRMCKACHQARAKKYQPVPADRCGIEHQNEFIDILRSRGIYASPGKSSEYLYADVVAWGCVRIEVKYGELRGRIDPHIWTFRFTEKQANGGMVADLIALMCPDGKGSNVCYLIEPTCAELYRDGKFKPVLTINMGTHRKNRRDGRGPLSHALLESHRDNWHVIEQMRVDVAGMFQQKTLNSASVVY